MLSSIASFLPSALHIGPGEPQKPPRFSQDDPASEDDQDDLQGSRPRQSSDMPQAAIKQREKSAHENFIIVRPPPSKSNHPLNLQVQLVPPNVKPPNGVVSQSTASVQSTATDTDHSLARTPSLRSDRFESSYTNYGSSTSSFSSVASSSPSTRRAIVPLYNLQAHNVMTNVIVDAGTDAKIAKFQRRGIILIDLVSLEPVEVWGDSPSSAGRTSINLNAEDQPTPARNSALSTRSAAPSSRAHTPDLPAASSAISMNSIKQIPSRPSQNPSSQPQPQPQHQTSQSTTTSASTHVDTDSTPTLSTPRLPPPPPAQPKRNIFGKLFQNGPNKKLVNSTNSPPVSPSFAISRPSRDTSPSTPRAAVQSQQSSVTPTSTGGGKSDRSHSRNISLTALTTPIRTTFKNNKNKITGSSSSSSLNANAPLDGQGVGLGITPTGVNERTVPSPNMSASSLAATNESMDSGSVAYSSAAAPNTSLQVPSYLQTPSHSHQLSSGSTNSATPQTQLQQLQSRAPVLGIQPTFVSSLGGNLLGPSDLKKIRALMYVWLVRKWLKRSPNEEQGSPFPSVAAKGGIFLGLGSRNKEEDNHSHSVEPGAGVEVRFEWKRGKTKGSGRGRTGKERSETDGRRPRTRQSTATTLGEWDDTDDREDVRTEREKSRDSRRSADKRLSSFSAKSNPSIRSGFGEGTPDKAERSRKKSLKGTKHAAVPGSEGVGLDGDGGEESDPEDSETPWVCTMKIRRTAQSSTNKTFLKPNSEKDVLKVKVGTLAPTPHHPKVVATLKIPFPLPDVEVERLKTRRRVAGFIPGPGGVGELGEVRLQVSAPGDPRSGSSGGGTSGQVDEYKGIELTAEEIKDIVCSTALWLIVREGTGGVGRVSRKGDGWKLRS